MDKSFFKARAGANAASLGFQDQEVVALRKMGFTGTLNDMRREFYQNITGDSFLADARRKAQSVPAVPYGIDYVGKVKGDGDNSRLAGWTIQPNFPSLNVTLNEFMGGYSNVATENGIPVEYETTNPSGQYTCFVFDMELGQYGSRDEVLRSLKSMKIKAKTIDANLYVFNYPNDSFDTEFVASTTEGGTQFEFIELDVTSKAEEIISTANKIRFMVRMKTPLDGLAPKKLQADFVKVDLTFFKSM